MRIIGPLVLCGYFLLEASGTAFAGDWPQVGGPQRNGISQEKDLLQEWNKDGPPLLWERTDMGQGLAAVSVVGSRVYTFTSRGKEEFVVALDRGTGKELWATSLGVARELVGMTSLRPRQPLIEGDRLYAFSTLGHLHCLEVDQGKELWKKKYREDFGGHSSSFGWTDYPLIDGDKLICTPGGKEMFHVALNKMTGEIVWKSSLPEGIGPSHSPMVVAEIGGRRLYVHNLRNGLVGISANDGKLLWRYDRVSNGTMIVPIPFVQGDRVFAVSGFGTGSALLQMIPKEDGIEIKELYFTKSLQNVYGGYALLGDHVYTGHSGAFSSAVPLCFDWKKGEVVWHKRGLGAGAVATIAADGHLYFRFADGLVVLAQASPEGFKEKGRFLPPHHSKSTVWSLPVIAHGRLFLRDQQSLLCYDLRKNPPRNFPAQKEKPGQDKSRQPDAVFIPSPPEVVDKMLELAKVTKNDVVYDLGCGDGRIVIAAAKKYQARGVGIELDPSLVKQARQEAKRQGVGQRVTIKEGDIFACDFQDATAVALYLLPHLNMKLLPKLKKLRPGVRIVSHAFAIEGIEPDRIVRVRAADGLQEHTLYLWTTPLRQRISADWPMLGRDQSRNPVSPEKNPPTWWLLGDKKTSRNIKWRVDMSSRNKADPVVAGGLIWVGGDRPRGSKDRAPALMCFREKDGKFLYQYVTVLPPGEQFAELKWVGHTSSPFIEGERMWFTTARCETVCLDIGPLQRGTGEPRLLWKVDMHKDLGVYPSEAPMGYGKACSIAGFRDFVYVQTGNGADWDKVPAPKAPSLVCFHKHTGKVIWSDNSPGKNIRDGQYASPLVVSINGKGQVIAPMGDGWVRSFDALTGELLWKFNANPPNVKREAWKNLYATPVYYEDRVYIGSGNNPVHTNTGNGAFFCLDPTRRGDISPEIKTDSGKFAANPNSGMVWRFNGENKKDLPRFGDTNASVAIDRGLVIAVSVAGYVHCLDAKTGQRYWVYDALAEINSAPLIVDGKIFVAADDHFAILELGKDRKVLSEIDPADGWPFAAPVFANGVLYVVTSKSLVAIAGNDKAYVAGHDWRQFGRDQTRNAVSPEKDPPLWWQVGQIDDKGKALPDKNIRWTAKLGTITYGDPVVVDGMVWIGTNNFGEKKVIDASVLLCLDEKSGEELYRYVSPRLGAGHNQDWPHSSMACSPLIEGTRLWFTSNRCEVVCLDIGPLRNRIGQPRVLWKVDMRQKLGVFPKGSPMALGRRCSIASYKDLIYVVTGNGVDEGHINVPAPEAPSLVCFNKNTGKVVWTDNSPGKNILHGQWASPLVIEVKGKAQVVAPQGDGWVRSFDAENGKLLWAFDTNPKEAVWKFRGTRNNLLATPVFYENRIYIGNGHHPEYESGEAWLYCIDPTKTGDISPELLAGPRKGKPNPNSGMVWKFGGRDAKTKQLRFHRTVSNVAIHQGLVIAPDGTGYIHCLDARTGLHYWTHDTRADIWASPLIIDGKIYVGTRAGEVEILALAKEKKVWEPVEMPNSIDCSPIFSRGTLYLATHNRLYAIAGKEKNPAEEKVPIKKEPRLRAPDAIFVPTPQDVVEKMLELAEVKKTDLVYDLGCGDGRIVITAAKNYGCRAAGFDLDPDCVKQSRANAEKENVDKLVSIARQDIFTLDLSKANVVALYLLPKLNAKLLPQLQKLKPGARIVSHQFPIEGIRPHRVVRFVSKEDNTEHTLYLWVAPLKKE